MAERAPRTDHHGAVKKRTRTPLVLSLAGRVTAVLVALLFFTLITVQFARVINQNVALARELSSTEDDINTLHGHRDHQMRELRRLESPDGSIPEIHDRLRLVAPNEAIIFVSPAPSAAPSSAP